MDKQDLPVAVIGAGPVGLAAAAHLLARGLTPVVFEAGLAVGHNLRRWGHVRMFSPWEYAIDPASAALLAPTGWTPPEAARYPTGAEVVRDYLEPLARRTVLRDHLRLGTRVVGVTRAGHDLMKDAGRETAPFLLRVERDGEEEDIVVRAVIDASGTYEHPNPLGSHGLPVLGERAAAAHVTYAIPDALGRDRARFAGRRVLVVGSGHSAFNALFDLATLAAAAPGTVAHWAVRRASLARVLGGGENDQLAERGRLGLRIKALVEAGTLVLHTGFSAERVTRTPDGLVLSMGRRDLPPVDEVVVTTGFRPDLGLLAELRTDLDPGVQSPRVLAPLIDPNQHSCGTVRPHGAEELKQPEPDLYIVGMKSYGRAPTFLLLTGYEQVRSVAAALAGDWDAARRVELQLPATGVCNTDFGEESAGGAACCGTKPEVSAEPVAASSCCGGPAKQDASACCVKDEDAKAAGQSGCGCSSTAVAAAPAVVAPRARCCG
jgi:thioredoxin reductase